MLDLPLAPPIVWPLAVRLPWVFSGRAIHRAALGAAACRSPAADALFERAAARYRQDLDVEPLARLRIHQLIARVWASSDLRRDASICLEIEQRLTRLDEIESLETPFELVPASRLLASWMHEPNAVPAEASSTIGAASVVPDAA